MNKALIAITSLLLAAVVFLFVKVFGMDAPAQESPVAAETEEAASAPPEAQDKPAAAEQQGNQPTGRIAYVNIDRLNEESLEIKDLVAESKRRQSSIESSMENLQHRYRQKVEEFQRSQQAGIAPESDLRAKAKEIENIEREAANKQVQMDNLTMDISDKNAAFQTRVRDFLKRWNEGRFDYVLSYSEAIPSVLLANATLEVTDEVIAKLNDEYNAGKNKKK